MARERIERPEGFVDPSKSFTKEQLDQFLKEILNKDESGKWIDHDETIDTFINEVNASKSIISNLNRNELMSLEGGPKQLAFCTYETFLDRLSKVDHIGKLAFRALILMVETEIRIGRENQLFGMGNEANSISMMLNSLGYRTPNPEKDKPEEKYIFDLKDALDEFHFFSENMFKSRVYSIRETVDPVTAFNLKRKAVVLPAVNIVLNKKYNILDYVPGFTKDVPTSAWVDMVNKEDNSHNIVPATSTMENWLVEEHADKYVFARAINENPSE